MSEEDIRKQVEVFRAAFVEKFPKYRYFSFSYSLSKVIKDIEDTIVDLDEKMYIYKKTNKKHAIR